MMSSLLSPSRSAIRRSGWAATARSTMPVAHVVADGMTPSRASPDSAPRAEWTAERSALSSASMRRAHTMARFPSGVSPS